jgi:hypothetical protein
LREDLSLGYVAPSDLPRGVDISSALRSGGSNSRADRIVASIAAKFTEIEQTASSKIVSSAERKKNEEDRF